MRQRVKAALAAEQLKGHLELRRRRPKRKGQDRGRRQDLRVRPEDGGDGPARALSSADRSHRSAGSIGAAGVCRGRRPGRQPSDAGSVAPRHIQSDSERTDQIVVRGSARRGHSDDQVTDHLVTLIASGHDDQPVAALLDPIDVGPGKPAAAGPLSSPRDRRRPSEPCCSAVRRARVRAPPADTAKPSSTDADHDDRGVAGQHDHDGARDRGSGGDRQRPDRGGRSQHEDLSVGRLGHGSAPDSLAATSASTTSVSIARPDDHPDRVGGEGGIRTHGTV